MKNYCFVIQPYDGGDFDNRFDDIIKPAVEACGLAAYRVDRDPDVEIAISAIEEKIRKATLIIAEISADNPNVWFELGYAMALDKTVIMLCDNAYRNGHFPFDISHRNVLVYRTGSMRDFNECIEKLKVRITYKLRRTAQFDHDYSISPEEKLILKMLSRDQKFPQAMTPEEKISKNGIDPGILSDYLAVLTKKRYIECLISTQDGKGYYQLTNEGINIIMEDLLCQQK